MILGFQSFHPLQGILPDTFPEYGGDIVFRARALLHKRSDEEIFAGIKIIDWLIEQSSVKDEALAELELANLEEVDEESHGIDKVTVGNEPNSLIRRDLYSSAYAMKVLQPNFDITGDESFPNASWAEMFAVLALSLVDQACEDERLFGNKALPENEERDDWFYEYRIVSRASYWLIEAMDAVATAEGFHRFESGLTDAKQKIKTRNQHAAIQRHSKTNEALRALKDFYLYGKHKSMRNAAHLFCDAFPDKVAHLAHYNRVRTLTEGLSNYLKDRRSSLQS